MFWFLKKQILATLSLTLFYVEIQKLLGEQKLSKPKIAKKKNSSNYRVIPKFDVKI